MNFSQDIVLYFWKNFTKFFATLSFIGAFSSVLQRFFTSLLLNFVSVMQFFQLMMTYLQIDFINNFSVKFLI